MPEMCTIYLTSWHIKISLISNVYYFMVNFTPDTGSSGPELWFFSCIHGNSRDTISLMQLVSYKNEPKNHKIGLKWVILEFSLLELSLSYPFWVIFVSELEKVSISAISCDDIKQV